MSNQPMRHFGTLVIALGMVGVPSIASTQGNGMGGGGMGGGGSEEIIGTDGPDTLSGDPGGVASDDIIRGLGGDDYLYGLLGFDDLDGGEGDDHLFFDNDPALIGGEANLDSSSGSVSGGPGNDFIYGDNGDNVIFGEDGDDTVYGFGGDDDIWVFFGNDTVDGGDGRDMIRVNTDRMQFIVNFTAHSVTIPIGAGIVVPAGTVVDVLDPVKNTATVMDMEGVRLGTANDDYFCGSDDNDDPEWQRNGLSGDGEFFGAGRGDDFISAGGGDDFIGSDRGDDTLIGGPGNDLLHGAENSDTFVFYAADFPSGENYNDTIDDFNVQADSIVLIGLTAGIPRQVSVGGKGKPDWEIPVMSDGAEVGSITTWDVNPASYIIEEPNDANWPDHCRPSP